MSGAGTTDSFGAAGELRVGSRSFRIHRVSALEADHGVSQLPYSMKVLLENLLRREDGVGVTADDVAAVAGWRGGGDEREIAFMPARVLMQDFTGVPAVVDLAAMRDAVAELGADARRVDPLVPAHLVIDHSIVADHFGSADALSLNSALEYERNAERYRFLRWGQQAFDGLRVVPPNTGICHQVNLEHLSQVVFTSPAGEAYPDSVLGTDSHTPMVNGLGVVAWGVGGIEAEAALLGQPVPLLIPEVVGFRLTGELPEGSTATDMVLTVTELLRRHGVVGRFVEFFGPGVGAVPLENRATIGNMSPEYGSTVTIFPIDGETLRYLRFSGRSEEQVALVEAYAKEQGLWHEPDARPAYTQTLELDLGTVEPSLAGPSRPQDRVPLSRAKAAFVSALTTSLPPTTAVDEGSEESFPASDPPAVGASAHGDGAADEPHPVPAGAPSQRPRADTLVQLADGSRFRLDHGHVVIAAITSCTNTSNPQVMVGAGLLARRAVERGLTAKPWVKTTLAPGSQVVVDYLERAGLLPALEQLGFHVVGFGCTTCIGNSGPLAPEVSEAVAQRGLAVASVLSGNRNFEGRINPDVRMNYLASPPLVVAYALAGTLDVDLLTEPLGHDPDGRPVLLRDLWPSSAEVAEAVRASLTTEMFQRRYAEVYEGDERWRRLEVPGGERSTWEPSTYVRKPPFLEGMGAEPAPLTDIEGARVLALLGDSVTTDHISPAGTILPDSPAGRWLQEQGVAPADFNSYGSRRGNHEVMIRGTFANPRIRNQLAPGTEGGVTTHQPSGEQLPIYDAAQRYAAEGVPLVVVAGAEYGTGSSRDWAAKGTALLGVRAVIAQSYERIHRSNLVGMGVLPLQLPEGESAASLGITGTESISIGGLAGLGPDDPFPRELVVRADEREIPVRVRVDTPTEAAYFRHGGILPFVARRLAAG